VARPALAEVIDQRLEGRALAAAVVGPDRPVAPRAVLASQQAEEEVKAARRLPERIALDVEEHVAIRRRRELLEAAPGSAPADATSARRWCAGAAAAPPGRAASRTCGRHLRDPACGLGAASAASVSMPAARSRVTLSRRMLATSSR
jgi:hypothetical protein